MSTPRFRSWSRSSKFRVFAGLLIGIGVIMMVMTQFLTPGLSRIGFIGGMGFVLAGVIGLLIVEKTRPR